MYTHEELLKAIDSFEPSESLSNQTKAEVKAVATQIGFNTPDATCKCKDKYNDLIIKLRLWAKSHHEPCHYEMQRGIIRKGPDGNIFALNLTDRTAEWLLMNDPEAPKYIKRIADDEPVQKELEELFEGSDEPVVPVESTEAKTKKKTKKKS